MAIFTSREIIEVNTIASEFIIGLFLKKLPMILACSPLIKRGAKISSEIRKNEVDVQSRLKRLHAQPV